MKKILAIGLCVVFFLSLIFVFSPFTKYRLYRVETGEFQSSFYVEGKVNKNIIEDLVSEADSAVKSIETEKGRQIKKGELIVTLTNPAYDLMGSEIKDTANALAESLNDSIALAGKNLNSAKSYLDGIKILYNQKAAALWQLNQAQESYDNAFFAKKILQKQLDFYTVLGKETVNDTNGPLNVTAPYDCIVEEITVAEGETVAKGDLLAKLRPVNLVFIAADIPRYESMWVKTEDSVEVSVKGNIQNGMITKMMETGDRTFVLIRCQENGVNEEEEPTVTFYRLKENEIISIPKEAVVMINHELFVWVADDDLTLSLRQVGTGLTSSGFTQITYGLLTGERVVANPEDFHLKEGKKLRVSKIEGGD